MADHLSEEALSTVRRTEYRVVGIVKKGPHAGTERLMLAPTTRRELALLMPEQYVADNYDNVRVQTREVTETDWVLVEKVPHS